MKTSEILEQAKAEIEKGWCQRTMERSRSGNDSNFFWGNPDNLVCALGAMSRVSRNNDLAREKYMEAVCVLAHTIEPPPKTSEAPSEISFGGVIAKFNDQEDRSVEDVLNQFDKAIEVAKEHEDQ